MSSLVCGTARRWYAPSALLCSVWLLLAFSAHAQPVPAPSAPVPAAPTVSADAAAPAAGSIQEVCGDGHFRLDGASSGADEAANFNPSWAAELDRIAACGKLLALTTSCLQIRGHYDTVEFKGAQSVVGGMARAQRLRAEGRASRVADELRQRGVAEAVLRHTQVPLDFATFRGASIDLSPYCRDGVVEQYAQAIAEELRGERAVTPAAEPTPEPVAVEPAPVQAEPEAATIVEPAAIVPKRSLTFGVFATPALHASLVPGADQGSLTVAGDLDGGVLARRQKLYASARAGVGFGAPAEDRMAWFAALSGGYQIVDWMSLGLVANYRSLTSKLGGPPLDKSWGLGLEGMQPLGELGPFSLYVWEQLGGVHRTRQGELVGGKINRIPEVKDLGAELSVGVRFY